MPSPKKRSESGPEPSAGSGTTPPSSKPAGKMAVRTHTPRPDELSRESFEFISAIDDYKRRHMRSFLSDHEVLVVLRELGYGLAGAPREPSASEEEAYAASRARYRVEKGRLFPTWSEVFELLLKLGYSRGEPRGRDAA